MFPGFTAPRPTRAYTVYAPRHPDPHAPHSPSTHSPHPPAPRRPGRATQPARRRRSAGARASWTGVPAGGGTLACDMCDVTKRQSRRWQDAPAPQVDQVSQFHLTARQTFSALKRSLHSGSTHQDPSARRRPTMSFSRYEDAGHPHAPCRRQAAAARAGAGRRRGHRHGHVVRRVKKCALLFARVGCTLLSPRLLFPATSWSTSPRRHRCPTLPRRRAPALRAPRSDRPSWRRPS